MRALMNGRTDAVPSLFVALLLTGASTAATVPYQAIVAVEMLGLSPQLFATLQTIRLLLTALSTVGLGALSDHFRDRRALVFISALAGAASGAIVFVWRDPLSFAVSFCIFMPVSSALFSQIFSYSRVYLDSQRRPSELALSVLRTAYSVSWAIVPPVVGWFVAQFTAFHAYGIAALTFAACALFCLALPGLGPDKARSRRAAPGESVVKSAVRWNIIAGLLAITLVRVAPFTNTVVLPLFVLNGIGGDLSQVGLLAGVAALVEVPFIMLWGRFALRRPKWLIICGCSLAYGMYMVMVFHADAFWQVVVLQAFASISSAALATLTISYAQDAIAGKIGLSTSLLDMSNVASKIISAALFGALVLTTNYSNLFLACGACAAIGAVALFFSNSRLSLGT